MKRVLILIFISLAVFLTSCNTAGNGTPQGTEAEAPKPLPETEEGTDTEARTEAFTLIDKQGPYETTAATEHTPEFLAHLEKWQKREEAWTKKISMDGVPPWARKGDKYFIYISLDRAYYGEIFRDCGLCEEDVYETDEKHYGLGDIQLCYYATPETIERIAKHPYVYGVTGESLLTNH